MKTMINNFFSSTFKRTLRALGAFSLLAMLASGEARAQGVPLETGGVWTQVASTCAPDEGSLSHQLSGAALESTTGEVTVRCNVTDLRRLEEMERVSGVGADWDTLEVTYRDLDGSAIDNQVVVELHRVSNVEELISTSINGRPITLRLSDFTLASINSNDFTATGRGTVSRLFGHNFDFVHNAYYVVIKVKRPTSGSTVNPAAFIIRLYHTFIFG